MTETVEGEIRGACARICEQLDGITEEWGTAAELRAERDDLEAQVTSLLGVIDEHDTRIADLSCVAGRQEERRDEARAERDTLTDRLLLITDALDHHDAPEADTPVRRIELWAAEWAEREADAEVVALQRNDARAERDKACAEIRRLRECNDNTKAHHLMAIDSVRRERDEAREQRDRLVSERDDPNLKRVILGRDEARKERNAAAGRLNAITAALDEHDAPDGDTPAERIELLVAEWHDLGAKLAQAKRGYDRLATERDEARTDRDTLADRLLFISAALDEYGAPEADTPVQRIELWADQRERLVSEYLAKDCATIRDLRADMERHLDVKDALGAKLAKVTDALNEHGAPEGSTPAERVARWSDQQQERFADYRKHHDATICDYRKHNADLLERLEAANAAYLSARGETDRLSGEVRALEAALVGARGADRARDWAVSSVNLNGASVCHVFPGCSIEDARSAAPHGHTEIKLYRLHSQLVSESRSEWVDA